MEEASEELVHCESLALRGALVMPYARASCRSRPRRTASHDLLRMAYQFWQSECNLGVRAGPSVDRWKSMALQPVEHGVLPNPAAELHNYLFICLCMYVCIYVFIYLFIY